MRPTDLGHRLLMDRSTVSRDLDRLEAAGLVRIGPGPSGRERSARVTETGKQRVAEAVAAWAEVQETTERLLGRRGRSALDTLVRLIDLIDARDREEPIDGRVRTRSLPGRSEQGR